MLEPVDDREDSPSRRKLQCQHRGRKPWRFREPRPCEIGDDQRLHGHQQLEEMRLGAFVGLTRQAIDRDMA